MGNTSFLTFLNRIFGGLHNIFMFPVCGEQSDGTKGG